MSRHTFRYKAGDDILLEFVVADQDGAPVDITGTALRFAIAPMCSESPIITTEESPASAIATLIDGPTGVYQVAVDGDATQDLVGVYRFESEVEDAQGGRSTIADGTITFTEQILRVGS